MDHGVGQRAWDEGEAKGGDGEQKQEGQQRGPRLGLGHKGRGDDGQTASGEAVEAEKGILGQGARETGTTKICKVR